MIRGASTAGSTRPTEPQVCCKNIATTAISILVKWRVSSGLACCNPKSTRRQRHPLPISGKTRLLIGRSQANVSRNQDVHAQTQAGQPAQDGGADQGAG